MAKTQPARDFTEQELRDRKIGTYLMARVDYGWDVKERTYRECKIKKHYTKLKTSYTPIVTDDTGWVKHDLAAGLAQTQIDTYLLRKSKGEDVELPRFYTIPQDVEEPEKKKDEEMMMAKSDFSDEAFDRISDPIAEIIWIFNHLTIEGVEPKDAPSPGAYGYLMWAQQNPQNRSDFLKTTYAKVVPTKSQLDKGKGSHDNGKSNIELLDRLSAEITPSP